MDAKVTKTNVADSGRRSRVVLAPDAGAKFVRGKPLRDDGGKRARLTGESTK